MKRFLAAIARMWRAWKYVPEDDDDNLFNRRKMEQLADQASGLRRKIRMLCQFDMTREVRLKESELADVERRLVTLQDRRTRAAA